MLREGRNTCEICTRLGKAECGYHTFKRECLSKISASSQKEDHFAQTRSSLNRIPPSPHRPTHPVALTPEKRSHHAINIEYGSGQRQNASEIQYGFVGTCSPGVRPLQPIHQLDNSVASYSRQIPVVTSNQVRRVQPNKVLYYPIFPVYEVVYEPLVSNPSFVSSPSRNIYR